MEYMLRSCILTYSAKWDECLPLAKFSYNNSYQESIKMHLSKLFMVEGVELHWIGQSLEKDDSLE